jgi:hypothetical protein
MFALQLCLLSLGAFSSKFWIYRRSNRGKLDDFGDVAPRHRGRALERPRAHAPPRGVLSPRRPGPLASSPHPEAPHPSPTPMCRPPPSGLAPSHTPRRAEPAPWLSAPPADQAPHTPRGGRCHTCFSKENQVQTYMHARIKFHAYSDI